MRLCAIINSYPGGLFGLPHKLSAESCGGTRHTKSTIYLCPSDYSGSRTHVVCEVTTAVLIYLRVGSVWRSYGSMLAFNIMPLIGITWNKLREHTSKMNTL